MNLHWIDLLIVLTYLVGVALVGFLIRKKASSGLDNYYLAGRNLPWWVLGIAGCSSYIDIGGTMALVGAFLGWQAVVLTLLVGCLSGSLVGLTLIALRRLGRREHIPFGPFLVLGALVSLFWGDTLVAWYAGHLQ